MGGFCKGNDKGEKASVSLAYYYTLGEPSQYSEEYYKVDKGPLPCMISSRSDAGVDHYMIYYDYLRK